VYLNALFISGVILFSSIVHAQSSEEIEQLKFESEDLVEQIEYFEKSLIQLEDALARTKNDFAKKSDQLETLKNTYEQDPSAANQRALNLVENAVLMSERSVSTQERRLARQSSKLDRHRQELIETYKLIAESEAKLSASTNSSAGKSATATETTPAQTTPIQPSADSQAKPEVNVASTKTIVSNPELNIEAPSPELGALQTEKSSTGKPEVATKNASVNEQVNEPTAKATVFEAEELSRVQDIMDKLASRLSQSPGRPTFRRLGVTGRGFESKKMEFLGSNQYRADIVLPEGDFVFIINGKEFKRTINTKNANKEHVFLFDAKRPGRPILSVFNREILEQIDAPIN
jgi:hypothetical protein